MKTTKLYNTFNKEVTMEINKNEAQALLDLISTIDSISNILTEEQRQQIEVNSPKVGVFTLFNLEKRLTDFVDYTGIR